MSVPATRTTIHELTPLLIVTDIETSVAFYCDRLGFESRQEWAPSGRLQWCRLERDSAAVMLQQECSEDGTDLGRGRGVTLYFLCDDADVMQAECATRGLSVEPPETAFYGMRQLFVTDPDGYALCFQHVVTADG